MEELFTDIEKSDPEPVQINGMTAETIEGSAKSAGNDIIYFAVLFKTKKDTMGIAAFIGDPIAQYIHLDTVTKMVASLTPSK